LSWEHLQNVNVGFAQFSSSKRKCDGRRRRNDDDLRGLGKLVGDSFFDSTRWTDDARIHAYAADHLVLALAVFSLKNFSSDRRLPTSRSLLIGA
jgi:hypothetical protein